MTTTRQFVNTSHGAAWNFADDVNFGNVTTVAGHEVFSRYGAELATVWANGSVSVQVRGRTAKAQGTVWIKAGEQVSFS